MKKNENDMVHPSTLTSRTITRSGIVNNGKELVVACGYTRGGQFGYFICWEGQTEHKDNKVLFEYTDVHSFRKKINERTLHEVLAEFKQRVETVKTA